MRTTFAASFNSVAELASRKVGLFGRSAIAGVEHAPAVLDITGSVDRRDENGAQEWRFAVTWAEPVSDPRFPQLAGYAIIREAPSRDRTRLVELSRGTTAFVGNWAAVPAEAETWREYVISGSTLGGENEIVPGTTPVYEVTVSRIDGEAGSEFTGNVTIVSPATVQYLPTADGTAQGHLSIPFSCPTVSSWGSCDVVAFNGTTYRTLARADS